jgi:hypothetical protein
VSGLGYSPDAKAAAATNQKTDGILYLLFSTFDLVYPRYYGFNEGQRYARSVKASRHI